MYRCRFHLSILVLIFMSITPAALAQNIKTKNPYIVIDAGSGDIIFQQKANNRWHPASLTKLMTAYVTFRAIKLGEIKAGSPVEISADARRQPPSKMGYKKGVKLRIDTALKIIIIKSANDVSHALGEAVAGNLSSFVARMNKEAARLGMINTRFTNSNGLHNTKQVSSARDMALLSAQILREFPQYAYMFEAAAIKTPAKTHYSYNLLLERFSGANGMKTGFVCASGYNMSGSATRNGRTLIAVVMGASSQTDRAVTTAQLLEKGFQAAGSSQGNVLTDRAIEGAPPKNMRPILCTQEARASRYDPGAGQAKIKSPFLKSRTVSSNVLNIKTGGITAPQSNGALLESLGKVAIPSPRPKQTIDVGDIILKPIGSPITNTLPVPSPRP